MLSDHGQTQGATFKQRNGYGLDDLVAEHVEAGSVDEIASGDENASMVGQAIGEATGRARARPKKEKNRVTGDGVSCWAPATSG